MITEKEREVSIILFSRYYSIILNAQYMYLREMPPKCGFYDLRKLCLEGMTNTAAYPFDKLCRWIGFVQGVLASVGAIDVDVERDQTRPFLHMLHPEKIPSFDSEKPKKVWRPLDDSPSDACDVWLLQRCGIEERGFYRQIWRKDGMQFVFLGSNSWMAAWREGDDACVSWCPREAGD
jgi:hypothetical protein